MKTGRYIPYEDVVYRLDGYVIDDIDEASYPVFDVYHQEEILFHSLEEAEKKIEELAKEEHLILVCGHYEGIDERVRKLHKCEELSIGDYVLSSGNLAAMVVIDAITRLLPGALGCDESSEDESFSEAGLLEYPQYTRPVEYRGERVPEVLQSGDHEAIRRWRRMMAEKLTRKLRPDLYNKAVFRRLKLVTLKEWKKQTKKFLIQKEMLKNGNSQEGQC